MKQQMYSRYRDGKQNLVYIDHWRGFCAEARPGLGNYVGLESSAEQNVGNKLALRIGPARHPCKLTLSPLDYESGPSTVSACLEYCRRSDAIRQRTSCETTCIFVLLQLFSLNKIR